MGMMYLFLPEGRNLDGMEWRAGAHMLNDDGKGWCRVLREIGAREITEEEYNKLSAAPAPSADPAPTVEPQESPKTTEANDGTDATGGTQRDQVSAADSIRANRPGRRYRRVA